ncbi:MAG: spore coat protein CotJB [Caldicoprobacterales bacterium]|nr:spore coat protein CotJB [Clostridiales bacterium]
MTVNDRARLLDEIRILEFMAVELNLYLDNNPNDHKAIRDYNSFTKQLMAVKDEYQRRYGPLSNFGTALSQSPWAWLNDPWPWELD